MRSLFFTLHLSLFTLYSSALLSAAAPLISPVVNPVWPRPVIVPVPATVTGVAKPVISLSGTWKISASLPDDVSSNTVDPSAWAEVVVPGQANRQGVNPGNRYAYKTKFSVPADFAGQRVLLQFEGVTGSAIVWVNGTVAGRHHGGFTVWDCDITQFVTPGTDAWLTVAVTEPTAQTSTNTYNGGIIRDVKLLALPPTHLTRFNVQTDLDHNYENATLQVWTALAAPATTSAQVVLTLTNPTGQSVPLNLSQISLPPDQPEVITAIPVASPLKWDAEHPNLYTLQASLVIDGHTVETLSKSIGFRQVEVSGGQLLVNGHSVKLRGAGQFDSDALLGRTLPPVEAVADVQLYKAANFNFVRPACYPASQAFLDACDRYGLYVEGECPVTFASTAAADAQLTPIFLSQAAEMVEHDRSHPSIILWNLANETGYGSNIRAEHDYIKAEDPSRPIIFSWSHRVPANEPLPYDIYSYHYPDYQDDLGRPGVAVFNGQLNREIPLMPVLADEFAHPPTYNSEELMRDPNVHNFWGQSIQRFWTKMFTTDGSIGGGVWAGIDDPIDSSGRVYGWGLLDVWRRPKPEYWLAKKAYSPVRVADQPLSNPGSDHPLVIPVKNWYDQTNLDEITVAWKVGIQSGTQAGPNVPPHTDGALTLPARVWQSGDILNLQFFTRDGLLIDAYNLPIDPPPVVLPGPQGPPPKIFEDQSQILLTGRDFTVTFNKSAGLLTSATYKGETLIKGGPYLNVLGASLGPWSPKSIAAHVDGNETVVDIAGSYDPAQVRFQVRVDGHGLITTTYTLDQFPITAPATAVRPWNQTNAGGFEEVGLSFVLTGNIDRLSWSRQGQWSVYPDDHIGRTLGTARRHGPGANGQAGVAPIWSWAQDEKDFNHYGADDPGGRGSNDFRSMKENIYYASAIASPSLARVRVESRATDAVRLQVADSSAPASNVWLFINNQWNYRNLGLGNYMKAPVIVATGYTGIVRFRLTDHDGLN
jgi:hypothetical protein